MDNPSPQNSGEPQLRDHVYDGIQEYDQKLPNWWLFTWYITMVWFVIAWLAYYQFGVGRTDHEAIDQALAAISGESQKASNELTDEKLWSMSLDAKTVEAGKVTFTTFCVACHGADLMSKKTHPEIPTLIGLPLADTEWKYGPNPTQVLGIVRKGSPDLTKGMPPWEPALGIRKSAEVVAYILSHHKQGEATTLAPDSPLLNAGTAAPAPAPITAPNPAPTKP
ncbi:MAG: c-type cytochrome [Verrucomicrobiaceae bacterium]|nr:c-type cytochrome [Verrucomicrobiaceae bacterium]